MIVLESVFNGVILACKCGWTGHVAYKDLHDHSCVCGRRLSDRSAMGQGRRDVEKAPVHAGA